MKKRYTKRAYSTGSPTLDRKLMDLLGPMGDDVSRELLQEILITCLKLGNEKVDRGEIKLLNTALKELRYSFKVFEPYRHVQKVAVFGSARTPKSSPQYKQASEFSRLIVEAGWMVITGASDGIMQAGNEGAGRANSFGVNIRLPFEQYANPIIADDPKLIHFKYFFTRKLIFIKESSATVLCPGGFGTHDEGFETLTLIQTGKAEPRPFVCLDPPGSRYWKSWKDFLKQHLAKRGLIDLADLDLIHYTHNPADAVSYITHFYRNYQSMRYIRDLLVMRIRKPLTDKQLAKLNRNFKDIVMKGKIQQQFNAFDEEVNEPPEVLDLIRVSFHFNRRHFARLTHLIWAINDA